MQLTSDLSSRPIHQCLEVLWDKKKNKTIFEFLYQPMATLQVEKIRANLKLQCSHVYLKVYGHEAEI
jgi:hypothetical protein